jgi:hypothetical protein
MTSEVIDGQPVRANGDGTTRRRPGAAHRKEPAMRPRHLTLMLHVDAWFNAAFAFALLLAVRPLAAAAGLTSIAPIVVLAAVAAVNATLCWRASDLNGPAAARASAAIDVAFALAIGAWALLAAAGVPGLVRWGAVAVADLAVIVAVVKVVGAQRLARTSVRTPAPAR